MDECIPFYEPGQRITGHCAGNVTGKRFVDLSADIQSGPGLSASAEGGNIVIDTATAGGLALGVASHNAAEGQKVAIIMGGVVPVQATGAITAGDEVEVGANGTALEFEGGRIVGRSLNTVANGEDAMVLLYQAVAGPQGEQGEPG